MTEDAAQDHLTRLQDLLTPEQQEVLQSFDLPRPAGGGQRGGGGGGGASGGGAGRAAGKAQSKGSGGAPAGSPPGAAGMMGGSGSAAQSNENPFKQEVNAQRLKNLRSRIEVSQ
jgi:hypothetical protein